MILKRGRPQKKAVWISEKTTKPSDVPPEVLDTLPPPTRIDAIKGQIIKLNKLLAAEKAKHPGAGQKPKWLRLRIRYVRDDITEKKRELAEEVLARSRLLAKAIERHRIGPVALDKPTPQPDQRWRDL